MIDTVVLTLPKDDFTINDPNKFTPSARWINNLRNASYGIQSKQNPQKGELRRGIYKPRLTLSARLTGNDAHNIPEPFLRIEFSVPKLMFGNNFDELRNKDYYLAAKHVLELCSRSGDLFIGSEVEERRLLIKLVLSNLELKDEKLVWEVHKPFDLMLKNRDGIVYCGHHNLFLAKARPDCDFKYFSKSLAFCISLNAIHKTISQGLSSLV